MSSTPTLGPAISTSFPQDKTDIKVKEECSRCYNCFKKIIGSEFFPDQEIKKKPVCSMACIEQLKWSQAMIQKFKKDGGNQ